MKFKYLILCLIITGSFYITDKIMIFIDNKNPIMKEIISNENKYNIKSVNAVIKDNTIIPGIDGKRINEKLSLIKMEDFGSFNENFLVYEIFEPKISINNHKDKIIIKGNPNKRSVSFILERNGNLENYLMSNNIKFDLITKINDTLDKKEEYLNGEKETENYDDLESVLKKHRLNNNLCLLNYSSLNECKKLNKYIVNYSINETEVINILNKIESGSIILISKNLSLEDLKLIINEVKRQDLKIVYLSQLIDEKN